MSGTGQGYPSNLGISIQHHATGPNCQGNQARKIRREQACKLKKKNTKLSQLVNDIILCRKTPKEYTPKIKK